MFGDTVSINGYVKTTNAFSYNYMQLRACILGYCTDDYIHVHHRQGRGQGQVPGGRRGEKRQQDGVLRARGCLALTLEDATYFRRSRTAEERDDESASRFVKTRG